MRKKVKEVNNQMNYGFDLIVKKLVHLLFLLLVLTAVIVFLLNN